MAKGIVGKTFKGIIGLVVIVLVVSWLAGSGSHKAHLSNSATAAPDEVKASTPPMPPSQRAFLDIVQKYATDYQSAANDMAKGVLRPARARALCALMSRTPNLMNSPWIGTVTNLSSNNSGKGILTVELADGITVSTTNNEFSDSLGSLKTLIDPGSPVSTSAAGLQTGQLVYFVGRFGRNSTDCLEAMDMTQDGAMTEPAFLFQFTSLRPIKS